MYQVSTAAFKVVQVTAKLHKYNQQSENYTIPYRTSTKLKLYVFSEHVHAMPMKFLQIEERPSGRYREAVVVDRLNTLK